MNTRYILFFLLCQIGQAIADFGKDSVPTKIDSSESRPSTVVENPTGSTHQQTIKKTNMVNDKKFNIKPVTDIDELIINPADFNSNIDIRQNFGDTSIVIFGSSKSKKSTISGRIINNSSQIGNLKILDSVVSPGSNDVVESMDLE